MRYRAVILAGGLLAATAAGAEPARVYTNADLDALGTIPTQAAPIVPAASDADWRFVIEFLDREHARLDVDRSLGIEEQRILTETPPAVEERWVLPIGFGIGRTRPSCSVRDGGFRHPATVIGGWSTVHVPARPPFTPAPHHPHPEHAPGAGELGGPPPAPPPVAAPAPRRAQPTRASIPAPQR